MQGPRAGIPCPCTRREHPPRWPASPTFFPSARAMSQRRDYSLRKVVNHGRLGWIDREARIRWPRLALGRDGAVDVDHHLLQVGLLVLGMVPNLGGDGRRDVSPRDLVERS